MRRLSDAALGAQGWLAAEGKRVIEALAFALLTFAVVVVALAQFHLYRLVRGADPHTGGWPSPQWPLSNLGAGDPLPATMVSSVGDEWAGLLLICSDNHDEYGVVASVMSVAAEWDVELVVAMRESGSATGWEARLPNRICERSFAMSAGGFDALGCRGTPVLLAVEHGRVVEATHDLVSPSGIADRIRYVAPQLGRPTVLTPTNLDNEPGSTE